MPLTQDTSCLYSTVKNASGGKKKFGFLPPHGRELDVDEELTVFGNILEAITRMERVTSRRHIQALERAIDAGDLVIVNTPNPILQDVSTDDIKMLQLDGGSLTTVDACWTNSL
jgi:hypothetical protein